MIDYYKELGVSLKADIGEIRRAYRSLAKRVHPDGSPHLTGQARANLEGRFIRLARAYDTLSDPVKRAEYDRRWRSFHTVESPRPHAGKQTRASSTGANARPAHEGGGATGRPRDDTADTVNFDDLIADAESLLRGFGLDLRQPFEQVLDALLNWALRLYREIAASTPNSRGRRPGPAPTTTPRGGGRPAGPDKRAKPAGAASGPSHKSPQRKRAHRAADIDTELAAIKTAVSKGRRAAAFVRSTSVDGELARLKRRRGPKR